MFDFLLSIKCIYLWKRTGQRPESNNNSAIRERTAEGEKWQCQVIQKKYIIATQDDKTTRYVKYRDMPRDKQERINLSKKLKNGSIRQSET